MGFHILNKGIVIAAVMLAASDGFANARTVAVIAGEDFPIKKMSIDEVAKIYKGDRLFLKNTRVTPLDNKDSSLRSCFYQEVLGMSTDDFGVYWITRTFQEGFKSPESVKSPEVFERIKEKGVLGFVDADDVKGRERIQTLLTIDVP